MVFLEGAMQLKDMNDPNFTSFYIDPAEIKVSLVFNDFKNPVVLGSKTQDEKTELINAMAPVEKEWEPFSKEFDKLAKTYRDAVKSKRDERIIDSLKKMVDDFREKYVPFSDRINKIQRDFFFKYPESFITAIHLKQHALYLPLDSLQFYYEKLGHRTQQTSAGKGLAKEIEELRGGSPGSTAQDFTSPELRGEQLSLSDYKGKYVLLDFWASWCVPCRKGNPHLKALYEKYKDKEIEFIGVADDDDAPDTWKAAIANDGIGIWKHVLRGMKRKNNTYDISHSINEKYGIQSLPTKILIDPAGKIIGRFSEDESLLTEMLKKIFGF
jgi:thiol-disulfide isomerase/thioredoxin